MSRLTLRALPILVGSLIVSSVCHSQQSEILGKKKDEWIAMLQTDKDPTRRRAAVIALGLLGAAQRDVGNALAAALREDKEAIVRQQVVSTIASMEKKDLRDWVPRLADALKNDKTPAIRATSAAVLGKLGELSKPVLSNLIAALKDEESSVRAAVAEGLGRMGADASSAIPNMLPLLKDKELPVRLATVFALGRLGAEAATAIPDLATVLTNDAAPEVRKEVARSIGLLGTAGKAGIPALLKALQEDKVDDVRQQTVLTLGKMGSEIKAVLPTLIEVLKKDKDKTVRLYIVRTLPSALGAEAKELVKQYADYLNTDLDGEVRLAIIQELGALGPDAEAALPALMTAQRDVQVLVREAATAAIKKIKEKPKEKDKE